MNNKNKMFFVLLLMGFIAVLIGANHKVNGNENAYITLITGMIFKTVAILCLLIYNSSKLKLLFK